ncbi:MULTISPECIES: ABC transporter ATP-binding protein [Thermoactinomyces]|jgi:oligopeptide transport system ATP-binding protein|uniref:ABC transporter ATP-binding protein n=1 Tax=Thermoactinomyces daqus TaxID=1329516 RepID=A0A7W1XBW8_9BACL|nr:MULTISPECIES: ABC transporter ATP-binding protein [Thermoactinomyces]MBA4543713.1 ABC transporter ATP-binding protein [Thermoactinomyces daqus]MBH8603835.1 ABC transporter ATP-binding protein [Thermoactinomyces sp. CICC 10522]MBH8608556.1 ABC transporter ATP-binding protein [Thermoactinomyces sp. CICC 10521]
MGTNPLLEVSDLHISFQVDGGEVQAVRGVTFALHKGEMLAVVGESGSGKSVTALSLMRLIPDPPGRIKQGKIMFDGKDLTKLSEREMFQIRGSKIAMIFQDPMTSLNPTMTVGRQIIEGIRWHQQTGVTEAKEKAVEMLKLVGIPNPEKRLTQYPHEFSGGMRQRVMIAMALACNPQVLIADEPTTALDVTIQAQILELMKKLQRETDTAIILITHDLGVVAETADRVAVMYGGRLVETGGVEEIFADARHPYTWGLLDSMPRLDLPRDRHLEPIPGSPPDLFSPPAGCPFADRCPHAMNICHEEMPPVTQITSTHQVFCWLEDPAAPSVERKKRIIG